MALQLLLPLLLATAAGDAVGPAAPSEPFDATSEAPPVESAPLPASEADWVKLTLSLSYELKNFSLGLSFRYLDYVETHVASDFLLTALLMGFGLDDLNASRVTLSQTVGTRLHLRPVSLASRFGPRPPPGPYPDLILGAGLWGLVELDSLAQMVRLGDAGVFLGASAGLFATFAFAAIDVTFMFRPLSTTAYHLDGSWDGTGVQLGNPVLELGFTYTFPW